MKKYFALLCVFISLNAFSDTGILFIAHGTMMEHDGSHGVNASCTPHHMPEWESYVLKTINDIKSEIPRKYEVAFGMWESKCFDEAIMRLENQFLEEGKTLDHLIVFPLFISSHSLVIEMQRFIFKKRPDIVLPIPHVHQTAFNGKITYMDAFDYDPHIAMILANRFHTLMHMAKDKGFSTKKMELILVMHGPVGDDENVKWMNMGERYAKDVMYLFPVAKHNIVSLRDDAPADVRNRITTELRALVNDVKAKGGAALVLPLLISKGGIDKGIVERLQGLEYVWTGESLFPDEKLKDVILRRLNLALASK